MWTHSLTNMRNLALLNSPSSTDNLRPALQNENFIRYNAQVIVVPDVDELRDVLKIEGFQNVENDAVLLLNSRRLDFADPKIVADIIRKRFVERNVQSPFDGLSDDEIFANIKSRHIQSFAELDNYAEYLSKSLYPSTLKPVEDKTKDAQIDAIDKA